MYSSISLSSKFTLSHSQFSPFSLSHVFTSSIPSGLDLSDYVLCPDEPQPVYDLYAISNHFGGMGGGHCKSTNSIALLLTLLSSPSFSRHCIC